MKNDVYKGPRYDWEKSFAFDRKWGGLIKWVIVLFTAAILTLLSIISFLQPHH